MSKTPSKPLRLSLAVQYGTDVPALPRWRLRRWVQRAVAMAQIPGASHISLTLRLVDQDEGQYLNRTYRGKDYATNVLTFEYEPLPGEPTAADQAHHLIGDIVICVPVLQTEARAQHKTFLDHAAHLVVHGTLHALGYDHLTPSDARTMEALETRILARFGVADPYAV